MSILEVPIHTNLLTNGQSQQHGVYVCVYVYVYVYVCGGGVVGCGGGVVVCGGV